MKSNFITVLFSGLVLCLLSGLVMYFIDSGGIGSANLMFIAGLSLIGVGGLFSFIGLVLLFTSQRSLGGQMLLTGLLMGLVGFGTCVSYLVNNLH
jgi:hypothetical protein